MTIEQIKAELSLRYGYQDWTALLRNNIDKKAIHIQKYIDEAIQMALEAKIIVSQPDVIKSVCDRCIKMYENMNGNMGLGYCKECEKLNQR